MNEIERPIPISTVLNIIQLGDDAQFSTELEQYIVEFKAQQPERPFRIAAILSIVNAHYPAEIGTSLEAYIADLETNQRLIGSQLPEPVLKSDPPPVWSHQRTVERERQRRERALRRLNDYR